MGGLREAAEVFLTDLPLLKILSPAASIFKKMADNALASQPASSSKPEQSIILNVLSPSTEVPKKLTFPVILPSTTVRELKLKIQDAVSTRPPPERQRLIYRGRPLLQDEVKLKDIFGPEMINGGDALSLHLVLPPIVDAPSPMPSAPPNSQLPSNTNRIQTATPVGQANPDDTPQHPTVPGTGAPPGVAIAWQNLPMPFAQGQMPPQAQTHLQHHLASLNQHILQRGLLPQQQLPPGGIQNIAGPPPNPVQMNPAFLQASFQHAIAQQQQARAAAGLQGVGDGTGTPLGVQGSSQLAEAPGTTNNTVVREGQGPNGSHWRMTINQTTMTNVGEVQRQTSSPANPPAVHPSTSPGILSGEQVMAHSSLSQLHETLSSLETMLAAGNTPSEEIMAHARAHMMNLSFLQHSPHEGLYSSLRTRLGNIEAQINQNRSRSTRSGESFNLASAQPASVASNPTVYLLSSPSGPHALLVTEAGVYTSSWQSAHLVQGATQPNVHQSMPLHHHNVSRPSATNERNAPGPRNEAVRVQEQLPHQRHVHQQPNQARDLIRLAIPLGGHIWLLIRLFGFVYFFTAGAGWRRTIFLIAGAVIVFLANTGIFRPLRQAVWEPLRGHVEDILPMARNEQRNRVEDRAPRIPEGADERTRLRVNEPTPRAAADRLLQEWNRRGESLARRNLRRVERAVALFVASLIPGVGERHAAEAVRQDEQREREEQARQGEAERQQREASAPTPTERGERSGVDEGAPAPAQPEAPQQPLVEI